MKSSKKEKFQVVPYDPVHEEALLALERMTPQGFLIKLEIIRESFLSRARLFEEYQAYTVLDQDAKPIAGGIGAQVPIRLKDVLHNAGFGFDVLVDPAYRNLGIGREIAKYITENYFRPKALSPEFTTLRIGNMPMLKLLTMMQRNTYLYEFIYLTFPTAKTIRIEDHPKKAPRFKVELLSCQDRLSDYYQMTDNGLGLWYTHKLYHLKVKSVSPVLSSGMELGHRLIRINKYVPLVGSTLKTVTIFSLDHNNLHTLPDVALQLYKEGVNYIQICCQPNDVIYKALHRSAINSYSYYLVSTKEMNAPEELCIDVRCL